ncbi:hypothetical protein BT96DRAFT_1045517 [Gymnopus androsaceus JB14]|uniref:Uncharacterized protein n=1 Tax=Gymnopus androsaceus JB14 TaxID=1447944 RepID=A0A6A4HA30_9AGAR|nr:hypothetical protein BT96DRAFT_1045517 [Gymnopus androsaceus JB14]
MVLRAGTGFLRAPAEGWGRWKRYGVRGEGAEEWMQIAEHVLVGKKGEAEIFVVVGTEKSSAYALDVYNIYNIQPTLPNVLGRFGRFTRARARCASLQITTDPDQSTSLPPPSFSSRVHAPKIGIHPKIARENYPILDQKLQAHLLALFGTMSQSPLELDRLRAVHDLASTFVENQQYELANDLLEEALEAAAKRSNQEVRRDLEKYLAKKGGIEKDMRYEEDQLIEEDIEDFKVQHACLALVDLLESIQTKLDGDEDSNKPDCNVQEDAKLVGTVAGVDSIICTDFSTAIAQVLQDSILRKPTSDYDADEGFIMEANIDSRACLGESQCVVARVLLVLALESGGGGVWRRRLRKPSDTHRHDSNGLIIDSVSLGSFCAITVEIGPRSERTIRSGWIRDEETYEMQ